jgi:DNA repair protein RadC
MPDKDTSIPHFKGHRSRLRHRFLRNGLDGLQDYEIIELFLTFTVPYKDVKPEAKVILERYGSIKNFFDADESDLKSNKFFKENALTLHRFIKEIYLKYDYEKASQEPIDIANDNIIGFCKKLVGYIDHEEFWIILLDSKKKAFDKVKISEGISNKTVVYPKQIIEKAIKLKAKSILLLHNHPNGVLEPSEQDQTITKAIQIPARLLDIDIYDHLIVSGDNHYSFKENKHL